MFQKLQMHRSYRQKSICKINIGIVTLPLPPPIKGGENKTGRMNATPTVIPLILTFLRISLCYISHWGEGTILEHFSWIDELVRVESGFDLLHQLDTRFSHFPFQIFRLGHADPVFTGEGPA